MLDFDLSLPDIGKVSNFEQLILQLIRVNDGVNSKVSLFKKIQNKFIAIYSVFSYSLILMCTVSMEILSHHSKTSLI